MPFLPLLLLFGVWGLPQQGTEWEFYTVVKKSPLCVLALCFLKSAFFEIANSIEAEVSSLYHQMLVWYFDNENVFQKLVQLYPDLSMDLLKSKYRHHQPNFEKYSYVKDFLSELKQNRYRIGLITDGFSITQRNKISSLGIGGLFDLIVISEEFGSEKPNEENYKV